MSGPPTVLAVEDDPLQRRLYESVLTAPEWRLVVASTLADADRALAEQPVEAVLLDLFLPDGDGRVWLGGVRERAEWASLPVIVIAGTTAVEAQVDFYALGASNVLQKPVVPKVLVAALQGVLARSSVSRRDDLVDPETGLPSRAALFQAFARYRKESTEGAALAVALLEPEGTQGAPASASVFRELSDAVTEAADPAPISIGRWDGSVLAVLFPGFDAAAAGAVLERARHRALEESRGGVRFSAGVAGVTDPHLELAELALDAGGHLTSALLAGGDRVRWRDGEGGGDRTILIAEDDDVVGALLTHRLGRDGFAVRRATNGVDAVRIARTHALALVILDVMMPGMDGFEVLGKLRAMPQYRRLPIIILSGLGGERDVERALALGANDYVIKPFSPVELTARVQRLLRAT